MLKGLQHLLQAFCMWVLGRLYFKLIVMKYNARFK
ncbi:hypothetical protein SAMN05421739_105234 [Pontibacter chinhatensis]|uniref:Uncharacterized protein n=1 Tax=Pontibacter chinhatensis TaxID=1436961 RepID=A0A1I2WY71_9BACT|nr:hypothetical protein SAMN05421739_105234 [Pontibacter chinhatensis]